MDIKHTRFAKFPHKGWLSMECNVDSEQARRHADTGPAFERSREEDSMWIPNHVAASAPELRKALQVALEFVGMFTGNGAPCQNWPEWWNHEEEQGDNRNAEQMRKYIENVLKASAAP